jgi:putative addiction module killer protein
VLKNPEGTEVGVIVELGDDSMATKNRCAELFGNLRGLPRLHFGPGYRIYFGKDGDKVVILLAGGTKKRQDTDIINAKERWHDYRQRKKSEK